MPAMLRSLRIRDLALVQKLEWELAPGFTAVTGETGAGKSVILGALKFLIGERADRGAVRSGAANAGIEAVFTLDDTAAIDSLLGESGIDPCQDGELILKRTIAAEGNGRQFVNGSACNLSVLKELGTRLVDLHGPHDHQSLFPGRSRPSSLTAFPRPCRNAGPISPAAPISPQPAVNSTNFSPLPEGGTRGQTARRGRRDPIRQSDRR